MDITKYATYEIGMERGTEIGMERGTKIGMELGTEIGKTEEQTSTAINAFKLGFENEIVSKITGLTLHKIKALRKKHTTSGNG